MSAAFPTPFVLTSVLLASLLGLFLMILELWQTEGMQRWFYFVTNTWAGKGLYIFMYASIVTSLLCV